MVDKQPYQSITTQSVYGQDISEPKFPGLPPVGLQKASSQVTAQVKSNMQNFTMNQTQRANHLAHLTAPAVSDFATTDSDHLKLPSSKQDTSQANESKDGTSQGSSDLISAGATPVKQDGVTSAIKLELGEASNSSAQKNIDTFIDPEPFQALKLEENNNQNSEIRAGESIVMQTSGQNQLRQYYQKQGSDKSKDDSMSSSSPQFRLDAKTNSQIKNTFLDESNMDSSKRSVSPVYIDTQIDVEEFVKRQSWVQSRVERMDSPTPQNDNAIHID